MTFSPDGKTLASASSDGMIRLWDAFTAQHKETIEVDRFEKTNVYSMAFSPDAKMLAGGVDKTVLLWNAATGQHLQSFKGHEFSVSSVVFSPDGTTLASGSSGGTILLWELR